MDQNAESSSQANRQLPTAQRRALGARIRERRRNRNWTQRKLARRIGLRPTRLSALENGHVTPSLVELIELVDVLGMGLDELVRGMAEPASPLGSLLHDLEEVLTRDEAAALAKLLRVLLEGFRTFHSAPAAPGGGR